MNYKVALVAASHRTKYKCTMKGDLIRQNYFYCTLAQEQYIISYFED